MTGTCKVIIEQYGVFMFIDYDMSRERKTAFQKEKRG